MSNNGKAGEYLFRQLMSAQDKIVQDVSANSQYFDKDIDFLVTNPTTGNTRAFEVKWDERISSTGNLFLEVANPRSKQWSGEGWWLHCQADYLVYGDAVKRLFYVFPLGALKERVDSLVLTKIRTKDDAVGLLLPLYKVKDLVAYELRE